MASAALFFKRFGRNSRYEFLRCALAPELVPVFRCTITVASRFGGRLEWGDDLAHQTAFSVRSSETVLADDASGVHRSLICVG